MLLWISLAWEFLKTLAAGDFKREWQEHKEKEAIGAQNNVSAECDDAVDRQLRDEFTKR